jgi:hypothetical protein
MAFPMLGDVQGKAHIAFECTHGRGAAKGCSAKEPCGYRFGNMGLAILAAFVLATFLFVRGRLPLSGRMGNSVNLIRTDREAEACPAWNRA